MYFHKHIPHKYVCLPVHIQGDDLFNVILLRIHCGIALHLNIIQIQCCCVQDL